MKLLSVDYGDVRTGIAQCDALGMLATPVGVIKTEDQDELIQKIIELNKTVGAQKIIVGLPKNMDGSEGFRAEKCKAFAEKLSDEIKLEVELVDERLTTVSAHKALNFTNTRGKKRKEVVDALSAVMILQTYLDTNK